MKRHGGTLTACESSQPEKATYRTVPTVRHSGKGETRKTVKGPAVVGTHGGGAGWTDGAPRIFGAGETLWVKLQWWVHVIAHLPTPTERTASTRALMKTVGSGWWWWVDAGSPPVTHASLWGVALMMGEAVHVWCDGVHRKSLYLPLNFPVNLKLL